MTRKNTVQVVCVAEFRALEGKTDARPNAVNTLEERLWKTIHSGAGDTAGKREPGGLRQGIAEVRIERR